MGNTLIMFGGRSYSERTPYDTFWTLDLNNKCSLLSIEQSTEYLVKGYVYQMFLKYDDYKDLMYPLSLNDIVINYLGEDINSSHWMNSENNKMMKKLSAFGYVLYDDRILIIFGGSTVDDKKVDDIYYIDLMSKDKESEGWKESTMKCPKSGDCQAVLVDDETIHIIPYYEYTEHFSIDVSYLIPSNLLNPNKPALKPRMSLNSLSNKFSNPLNLLNTFSNKSFPVLWKKKSK